MHASTPLASPPLSPALPYRIPPDRSRGPNVSFRTSLGYLNPSLLYPPLPYRPNIPLPYPTHLLPTFPLLYPHIPSTPLISLVLIPYPTVPSPLLPSPLLPSPLLPSPLFSHLPLYLPYVPYAPISSGLPCSTQRFRKSQRPRCPGTRMYRGRNCLVQNVFWRTEMNLSLKGPGNV